MRRFLESLFAPSRKDTSALERINALRQEFSRLKDNELRVAAARVKELHPLIAMTAVIAFRVLGLNMFDVQLRGALALTRGSVAEMQTGEGKTLAAVPAIAWYARQGAGVHVMTVNDYLARRDAAWMGEIYRWLGLSVAHVEQGMSAEQRRAAYRSDITYATANEIGFDFLRDQLALRLDQQVHRSFGAAVIDEADSILIDEARVPLVIAGGDSVTDARAHVADQIVRGLRPGWHSTVDVGRNNVALTDAGITAVERALCRGSLYDVENLDWLSAIQDALHAHVLLRRDVDYIVKNGVVEMVDEFKGRVALDRRWPASLHAAVEIKEGVAEKRQGRILGQITLQQLVAIYPQLCGMTGTAASQAGELSSIYGLNVEVIPTHKPVIRVDHPDLIFRTQAKKEHAVLAEIHRAHAQSQPVLVGTGSVAESERLSRRLHDIPHQVLNARNDEAEAAIIAQAGQPGAVTISTNMAGRGTDIQLGPGAAEAGGLYVIGMQRHESRRIDNQLRGRSGRQGDPGSSRFFLWDEDDLLVKYADLHPHLHRGTATDIDTLQRLVEGRHLDARLFLQKYETPIEGQRNILQTHRQQILDGTIPCDSEQARLVTLKTIDDAWADYLERLAEFRGALPWIEWASPTAFGNQMGKLNAYQEYAHKIDEWFSELRANLPDEIERRIAEAERLGTIESGDRGATWTYLTTDQPFGSFTERLVRGLKRRST